jgi:hypothetical protein
MGQRFPVGVSPGKVLVKQSANRGRVPFSGRLREFAVGLKSGLVIGSGNSLAGYSHQDGAHQDTDGKHTGREASHRYSILPGLPRFVYT